MQICSGNPTYRIPGTEIGYNGDRYREGCDQVREARRDVDSLPPEVQQQVLEMLEKVTRGALAATEEVLGPLVDPEKLKRVERSNSDFATDLQGPRELLKLFEAG